MGDVDTTRHDVRVHRHDDGYIEVQIDGKTSGCNEGSIMCAFRRAWDWAEHGETYDRDRCFAEGAQSDDPNRKHTTGTIDGYSFSLRVDGDAPAGLVADIESALAEVKQERESE